MVERTCCAHIIVNRKGNGRMLIDENVFFFGRGCVWVRMKLLFSLFGGFTCRELVFDLVAWCSVAQIAVRARRSVQVFCLDESLMSILTRDSQKLCLQF